VGCTLVCVGLFANEWVLTAAFSSDGVLERETTTIIRSVDLLLIIAGTLIILARKFVYSRKAFLRLSQTYPRTVCFLIGIALSASLVLSLEGIFYFINHRADKGAGSETGWLPRATWHDRSLEQKPAQPTPGPAIEDELLGYKPPSNAEVFSTKKFDGDLIFNVVYSTDEHNRRITPVKNRKQRNRFILFFGCSMVFGEGVGNEETMPFYVAQYAS